MKTILKAMILAAFGAGSLAVVATSYASAVIGATRIVFPSEEREVTVRLSNEGTEPSLIQVWIDNGDEQVTPDTIKVPFVLTPPMFRMDGGKSQTVRMLFDGTALPKDRESLFWFNMLEVGPKPTDQADLNYVQMAFRTRIKIFYRPKPLNSAQQIDDAFARLRWRLQRAEDGSYGVMVDNPTPYHVNLIGVSLMDDGKPVFDSVEGGMAEPGKSARFVFKDMNAVPAAGTFKVRYTYLNDFGGSAQKEAALAIEK